MSTDRPTAKGGAHTPRRTPSSPTTKTNLEKMKTNPGNYYLTLTILRQEMEGGGALGIGGEQPWMVSPKHAQAHITDVPVFVVVAAAECSAPHTKHLVQRWIVNLPSTKNNRHNNDFKR